MFCFLWRTIKIEDVRAVFILLQSPLFDLSNSCVVFAYLLKLVVRIPLHDKQLMRYLHWLDPQTFRRIIHRLHGFISLRLFPPSHINLPVSSTSKGVCGKFTLGIASLTTEVTFSWSLVRFKSRFCQEFESSITEFPAFSAENILLIRNEMYSRIPNRSKFLPVSKQKYFAGLV